MASHSHGPQSAFSEPKEIPIPLPGPIKKLLEDWDVLAEKVWFLLVPLVISLVFGTAIMVGVLTSYKPTDIPYKTAEGKYKLPSDEHGGKH